MPKHREWTAEHILGLLRARHEKDVFIPGCRTGPSWSAGDEQLRVIDAWVLRKTWSPWRTDGYEIKVSRSDFEGDQKWGEYLPYCHAFSFVCPGGLIRPADLPDGVGLLWVSQNGQRLHQRVRPTLREPNQLKLSRLMSYALMSRSRIVRDMLEANGVHQPAPLGDDDSVGSRLARVRREVELAEERGVLATFVGRHVRKRVEEAAEAEKQAEEQMVLVREFQGQLARLGIVWDEREVVWRARWRVREDIERLVWGVQDGTLDQIERGAAQVTEMIRKIRELRESLPTSTP